MRYVLTLEAIGDSYTLERRRWERSGMRGFGRHELDLLRYGRKALTPWVARLVGLDGAGRFMREFAECYRDYTAARTSGQRGIFLHYPLSAGLYEVNERTGLESARRYFTRVVDDETAAELSREEVMRCLRSQQPQTAAF